MSILYYIIGSLDFIKKLSQKQKNLAIEYVFSTAVFEGKGLIGFKNSDLYDFSVFSEYSENTIPHLRATFQAMSVLKTCGYDFKKEDKFLGIPQYIAKLQREDGAIKNQEGDSEADPQSCYYAVGIHALLETNVQFNPDKLKDYLLSVVSHEGGFSQYPGGEAQSSLTHGAVACLLMLDYELEVDFIYSLKPWIMARMRPEGCNSGTGKEFNCADAFWNLAALTILGCKDMVDRSKVRDFILSCQVKEGGFSNSPEVNCSLESTFFGLAGLSLSKCSNLKVVNPFLVVANN